jgi:parvulin-like peptidyl-prolyl isomerase
VAYVGSTSITASELEARYQSALSWFPKESNDPIDQTIVHRIKKQLLEDRIDELILLQEARHVIPLEQRKAMWKQAQARAQKIIEAERTAQPKPPNPPERQASASDEQTDDEAKRKLRLARQFRDRTLIESYVARTVRKPTLFSRDELLDFYTQHRDQFYVPETATFRAIQLGFAYFQSNQEAIDVAEQVRKRILAGEKMEKLARDYSLGPDAEQEGLWEKVTKGGLKEPLNELVFSLPVGVVSSVVATDDAAVVARVESRQPGVHRPFEDPDVQREIKATLQQQKTEAELLSVMKQLHRRTPVDFYDDEWAKLASDDYRSVEPTRLSDKVELRQRIARLLGEELDPGLMGEESNMLRHPLGPALLASITSLIAPTAALSQVHLQGRVEPITAEVLEQTRDYVVLRVPRDRIEQIKDLVPAVSPILQASYQPAKQDAAPSAVQNSASLQGTWREDDEHIIITVNGREVKLAKKGLARYEGSELTRRMLNAGSVEGRILDRGRPLAECEVQLVPLLGTKVLGRTSATIDNGRSSLLTKTDAHGSYVFEDIPEGSYKLYWRPKGSTHWIRRIAMQSDLVVQRGKKIRVDDVKVSTQTIN